MAIYVADTHALLWYLRGSPKLGSRANHIFDEADAGRAVILIPVIALAELHHLNRKRPQIDFFGTVRRLRALPQFQIVPLTVDDVLDFERDERIKEMHDRIIAGVARRHGAALLTRDRNITKSGVEVVW